MVRDTLAKKLKYYRELNKMTVYEVGTAVGKSGKTISAWEVGRGQPDADMLITLCKLYHINSIADLFGDSQNLTNTSVTASSLSDTDAGNMFDQQPNKNKALSDLHQKALAQLEKMNDDQIRAVLAFINSLDEVEKSFNE